MEGRTVVNTLQRLWFCTMMVRASSVYLLQFLQCGFSPAFKRC